MYKLRLQAVDSLIATEEELIDAGIDAQQIPKDEKGESWSIMKHQAATVKALRYGTAPIIINQAMTGDGKTMAGRFQLLSKGTDWRTFAMYPTNELAHDQVQSFDELMTQWIPPVWGEKLDAEYITAARLDDFEGFEEFTRFERLENLLQSDYVMTNPDIFHWIMNFGYKQYGTARDLLPSTLATWHRLFIFDEFHLFGVEQVCSVMTAMLLLRQMKHVSKAPRFLFLSATPQAMLISMAERLELEYEIINGQYIHGEGEKHSNTRRILQASDLNLYTGSLEEWVIEHYEDIIKPFFQKNNAKGLIVANSIASAHRIFAFLKKFERRDDIDIDINTALARPQKPDFDILVATSTVDVGVDFKINFLAFESMDSASHTQRLGRLGRHTEDKNGNRFKVFEAHAILPQWVLDGLQEHFPEGEFISRLKYKEKIEEYFGSQQEFERYVWKWGWVQATKVLQALNKWDIQNQYEEISQVLEKDYATLFSARVSKAKKVYQPQNKMTWDTAASFRGGNNFTGLLYTPFNKNMPISSYNLITILRNGELEAISLDEAYRIAEKSGQKLAPLKRAEPLVAYRLHDWCLKPREILVRLDVNEDTINTEIVIEQNRITLDIIGIPELQKLNEQIEEKSLVAFIIPAKEPNWLRRYLKLGFQIELFKINARGLEGTVAFGRDALLLDAAHNRYKSKQHYVW